MVMIFSQNENKMNLRFKTNFSLIGLLVVLVASLAILPYWLAIRRNRVRNLVPIAPEPESEAIGFVQEQPDDDNNSETEQNNKITKEQWEQTQP
jgi:hypothetical protein